MALLTDSQFEIIADDLKLLLDTSIYVTEGGIVRTDEYAQGFIDGVKSAIELVESFV